MLQAGGGGQPSQEHLVPWALAKWELESASPDALSSSTSIGTGLPLHRAHTSVEHEKHFAKTLPSGSGAFQQDAASGLCAGSARVRGGLAGCSSHSRCRLH